MRASKLISVLVVDDHPVASNGAEAVATFEKQLPNVTLMDLRMPDMSGVDAIRTLRKNHPASRFIVLTTYQGDQDIERALSASAEGYLLKGMPGEDLVNSIRSVHTGLRVLPPPVLQSLAERPANSDLSSRELDILNLIVKGLSNRQIGDTLCRTQAVTLKRGIVEL